MGNWAGEQHRVARLRASQRRRETPGGGCAPVHVPAHTHTLSRRVAFTRPTHPLRRRIPPPPLPLSLSHTVSTLSFQRATIPSPSSPPASLSTRRVHNPTLGPSFQHSSTPRNKGASATLRADSGRLASRIGRFFETASRVDIALVTNEKVGSTDVNASTGYAYDRPVYHSLKRPRSSSFPNLARQDTTFLPNSRERVRAVLDTPHVFFFFFPFFPNRGYARNQRDDRDSEPIPYSRENRIGSFESSPPNFIANYFPTKRFSYRIVSFLSDGSTTDDGGSRFSLFPFLSDISVRAQLVKLVYRSIEFWNCLVAIFFRTNRVGRKEEKDAKQMIKI